MAETPHEAAPGKTIECPCCAFRITPKGRGKRPRSEKEHRRYFVMLREALRNWPESHPIQFPGYSIDAKPEVRFRKWLQIKAGRRDIKTEIPLLSLPPEHSQYIVQAALDSAGETAVADVRDDPGVGFVLVIYVSQSIQYSQMDHYEFNRLHNDVASIIYAESGIDTEKLLAEKGLPR